MRIVDLGRKTPGYNRIPDVMRAVREGEQILLVTRRGGEEVGMVFDRDILRLTETMRRLGGGMQRLRVQSGGIYAVDLDGDGVARARKESEDPGQGF